jgi:hypothetical protein
MGGEEKEGQGLTFPSLGAGAIAGAGAGGATGTLVGALVGAGIRNIEPRSTSAASEQAACGPATPAARWANRSCTKDGRNPRIDGTLLIPS